MVIFRICVKKISIYTRIIGIINSRVAVSSYALESSRVLYKLEAINLEFRRWNMNYMRIERMNEDARSRMTRLKKM